MPVLSIHIRANQSLIIYLVSLSKKESASRGLDLFSRLGNGLRLQNYTDSDLKSINIQLISFNLIINLQLQKQSIQNAYEIHPSR